MKTTLCIAVALAGCGIADFDLDQKIVEQHVQGSNVPAPLGALFPFPLSLDLSAQIKKQNSGPIDSITLKALSLKITDTDRPAGDVDDWSFVTSIHVYVKSSASSSTLPRVEVASIGAPGAVTSFDFDIAAGVNLKPYVDEGSVVESTGTGSIPADDESYDGSSTFTVHPL